VSDLSVGNGVLFGSTVEADHVASGLNEYFSDFDNIGHNEPLALIFLWIIPK
jgi:hypothetical protein